MTSNRVPCEPPFILLKGQWPTFDLREYQIMNVCRDPSLAGFFSGEEDFISAPFAEIIPALDVYLQYQGLLLLKSEAHCRWEEMNPALAEGVLAHMIATGMVYSHERFELDRARRKAHDFVSSFNAKVRYFTCAEVFGLELGQDGLPPENWRDFYIAGVANDRGGCLTTCTFGTGVLALDTDKVGVYWIHDED